MSNKNIEKAYYCEKCDYTTSRMDNYKRHLESKLHKMNIGEIEKKQITFECDKCDYKSNRKYNVERHILAEHTNKKIKCEYCETEHKGDGEYNEHRKKRLHRDNTIIKLMTHRGTMNGIKKTILNELNEQYINYKKTKTDNMPSFPNNFNSELYYKLMNEKSIIESELINELSDDLKIKYKEANENINKVKTELNTIEKLIDNKEIDKTETFSSVKRNNKRKNIFIYSESEEDNEEASEELKHKIIKKQDNESKNEVNKLEQFKQDHEYLLAKLYDTIEKLRYFEHNDYADYLNEFTLEIMNDDKINSDDKANEIHQIVNKAIVQYISDD
jgi:hypothetical protein